MQAVFNIDGKSLPVRASALTIGNFDGVHLGHQELIKRVCKKAKAQGIPSVVLTFDPHPVKVLFPERQFRVLFDLTDRVENIEALGVDLLVIEPFSRDLSELSAESFFQRFVVETFRAKILIVGHDFSFGRNREGSLEALHKLCLKSQVLLEIVEPILVDGETVSSSQIRQCVVAGELEKAEQFLGRPFYLKGVVGKGAGRGKGLGFATANLVTKAELFPNEGVYATQSYVGKKGFPSVTNVGRNPTFAENLKPPIQIETHFFDFDQDIYGETLKVDFLKYLRPEKRFSSVNELKAQIKKDVAAAKSWYLDQKAR